MRPLYFLAYILFTLYSCTSRGAEGLKDNPADSTTVTEDDGGKKNKQDDDGIITLQPFSIKDYQKEITYSKARDIKLQKVGLEDLKKITGMSNYTWFVVWASWCPHCREGLHHYPATADKVRSLDEDMNIVLIAEDYNLPQIQERLFEIGYKKQAYVLDPVEFGMDEEQKITKLRKYLCPTCSEQEAVVPQHYLFNKDGQIVYDQVGGDVTDINIMTAIHSK